MFVLWISKNIAKQRFISSQLSNDVFFSFPLSVVHLIRSLKSGGENTTDWSLIQTFSVYWPTKCTETRTIECRKPLWRYWDRHELRDNKLKKKYGKNYNYCCTHKVFVCCFFFNRSVQIEYEVFSFVSFLFSILPMIAKSQNPLDKPQCSHPGLCAVKKHACLCVLTS